VPAMVLVDPGAGVSAAGGTSGVTISAATKDLLHPYCSLSVSDGWNQGSTRGGLL
jgi:hypothetical protein